MNPPESVVIFRGEQRLSALSSLDRGLAYGDGVFETMRVFNGDIPLWSLHVTRLLAGLQRLKITRPDAAWLHAQAQAICGEQHSGVCKLIVTRGEGGRGYAPSAALPTIIFSWHELPPARSEEGLHVRWCDLRLSEQPALAGIKHCNRLEQVLARAEWDDANIHEGLLCSHSGPVISATAANVFALVDGRFYTPKLERCGVAGVMRAWLLAQLPTLTETELMPADIEHADGLFLANAVRGILPVRQLGGRHWPVVAAIVELQNHVAKKLPMFAVNAIRAN